MLEPDNANVRLKLVKVLIEMDQQDKVLPQLKASAQLELTNAAVYYRLAMLYRKLCSTDDARHEVEIHQNYEEMKDNLRVTNKELPIQPDEILAGENPEEEPCGKR